VRRTALSCVAAASLLLAFTAAHADSTKLDPRVRIALTRLQTGTSPQQLRTEGTAVSDQGMLDVFIRGSFSPMELQAMGVVVRTQLPGLVTAYVPASAVDALVADPNVVTVRGAVLAEPNLNVSVPTTGADVLRGAGPTFTGLNGAGVLVGDVDTGIDIHHGDFKDATNLSRIKFIWDQTVTGTPPSGFSIGTEWTKAQIDGGTCTETDTDGHGSHCMGIAAGDGSQTGGAIPAFTYVGMAPMADITMVKTTFETTDILDGVNYIFQKATSLSENAVVNLSLGSEYGPHDDTSDFETGLDALSGPGRIVSVAAGNDRGTNWHAGWTIPAGGDSVKFSVTGTTNLPLGNPSAAIDGYYNNPDNFNVTLRSPTGASVGPIALGGINAAYPGTLLTGSANVYIENGAFITSSGAREVYIEVTRTASTHPVAGTWTLTFTPVSVSNGRFDAWKFYSGAGAATFTTHNTNDHLVSEPGDASAVITVAAYATKASWTDCGGRSVSYSSPPTLGDIASFSGIGPTRDGRNKPDIAAPGFGVGSVKSADNTAVCGSTASALLNDGSNHTINQGTSMAAPHVTGAAALLMQKFGAWTPAQIKTYLNANATLDGFTGSPWNASFGNGKLHLGDLVNPTIAVTSANGGENWFIGSSQSITWTASDNVGVTSVDIYLSRSGVGGPFETIALGQPNSGSYPWTVTGPATSNAYIKIVAHDAANNTGTDLSDASFFILEGATATLLSTFVANPIASGIELRWELNSPGAFSNLTIERATSATGPWNSLALTTQRDGQEYVAVDASVSDGQTYLYRLTGTSTNGQLTTLGQISGTAGQAITAFALTRVAPNPTKDVTNVEFAVPRTADVKVAVLDVAGRVLATLASGSHAPGRYQVLWSGEIGGRKAPSGLYFVRMQAPGVQLTRRIAIAR